jgi:hypothetical protein
VDTVDPETLENPEKELTSGGIPGAGITMRYKHISRQAERSRRLRARLKMLRGAIVNI